jgi:hypothetical protein
MAGLTIEFHLYYLTATDPGTGKQGHVSNTCVLYSTQLVHFCARESPKFREKLAELDA